MTGVPPKCKCHSLSPHGVPGVFLAKKKILCILGCKEFSLWRLGLSSSFALAVLVCKQGRAQRQRALHSLTLLLTREVGTWQRAHLGDRERTALMFHMCVDGRFADGAVAE